MHPAIIIGTVRSLIVDVAMGQIPRSTERISSFLTIQPFSVCKVFINSQFSAVQGVTFTCKVMLLIACM